MKHNIALFYENNNTLNSGGALGAEVAYNDPWRSILDGLGNFAKK